MLCGPTTPRQPPRVTLACMTTEFDADEVARKVVGRLQEKFPKASVDDLEQIVREEVAILADKPVHDYVAVLAERAAKKRLKRG